MKKAANYFTPLGIAVLAILLLSVSFYINWKLQSDTHEIIEQTQIMYQQLQDEDWSAALSTHQHIVQNWQEVKATWALFTNHQQLTQVSERLIRLYYALEMKDPYEARIELTTLHLLLVNFPENERLNLKNLF